MENEFKISFKCEKCVNKNERNFPKCYGYCDICGNYELCYNLKNNYKETHKRSMTKSIIWRIMGVFVYATIFYLYTRQWGITIAGTLIHHTTFLFVFYLHERFWIKLKRNTHWLKPITYEIVLGMGLGGLIVLMLTGSWKAVTVITVTYTVVKLIMYFIYDRIWKKVEWGKEE